MTGERVITVLTGVTRQRSCDADRAMLSPHLRERADALNDPAVRHRFVARRADLERHLRQILAVDDELALVEHHPCATCGRPDHGAPRLRDIDRRSLWVSLSSCATRWVAALAPDPVGIDIEELSTPVGAGVLRRAFSCEESERLSLLPREERSHSALLAWTVKEAFAKAWGLGLRTDLARIPAVPTRPGAPVLGSITHGHSLWEAQTVDVGADHACVVTFQRSAVGRPPATIRVAHYTPAPWRR